MLTIDWNMVAEASTAISAIIALALIIIDRFIQVCVKAKLENYTLTVERNSFGALLRANVPAIVTRFRNYGRLPVYICDVYLLVNDRETIRVHPYELYTEQKLAVVDPGRSRNAIFYGQGILDNLPGHIGEKLSLRVVFVSEIGRKYKSRKISACRNSLSSAKPNR